MIEFDWNWLAVKFKTDEPETIIPDDCSNCDHAWRGQDNAGKPIDLIYYGCFGWPSRCYWMIPGTESMNL